MKRLFFVTILAFAVIYVSSTITTGVFTALNTTASLNCRSVSGWLSFIPGTGSPIFTEAACRGANKIVDLIGNPTPEFTDENVPDVIVFAPNLPDVPGAPDPTGGIPQLIAFIYGFAVWVVGAVTFVQITRAGVILLIAAGSPGKINEARELATNAIFGLILLLSSVVLLNTINPTLTQNAFELPPLVGASPGLPPGSVP